MSEREITMTVRVPARRVRPRKGIPTLQDALFDQGWKDGHETGFKAGQRSKVQEIRKAKELYEEELARHKQEIETLRAVLDEIRKSKEDDIAEATEVRREELLDELRQEMQLPHEVLEEVWREFEIYYPDALPELRNLLLRRNYMSADMLEPGDATHYDNRSGSDKK